MPRETTWYATPHTLAKIRIVEEYLKAWFPILSSRHRRVIYVDGFCGPGVYKGGEKGSPIAAVETALNHTANLSPTEIVFVFVDKDKRRIDHLKGCLGEYSIPPNLKCHCIASDFEAFIEGILDDLEHQGTSIAPTFMFLDPFGVSQTPFRIIRRFMRHPRCEILVNFMYRAVGRFSGNLHAQLDDLYGTDRWRECLSETTARERFLLSTYEDQIRTVARYVWSFRMVDSLNTTTYYLVFGTKHIRGLERMKEAMWKISPTRNYQFSDRQAGQISLFGSSDPTPLRRILMDKFRGRSVSIDDIEEFVLVNTDYLKRHIRKPTLVPLEDAGCIEVLTSRRRRGQYPQGTIIRFLEG